LTADVSFLGEGTEKQTLEQILEDALKSIPASMKNKPGVY
jgi:hypothetical protein